MRYRLLDREQTSFGLLIDAEPRWGRIDETSGEPVDRCGVDLVIAIDKELIPNRVVAAFNALYGPEVSRSRVTGITSQESFLGFSTALMTQVRPGIFVGAEARYARRYEGLGLDRFAGHAVFLGPTIYANLSERSWIAVGWSTHSLQAERLTSRVGSISPTSSDIRRDFYSALPFDGAVAVVCAACIGLAGRICYEYRQLAETAEDPSVKPELFDLAAACEEVANNIEDRMPGG